MMIRRVNYTGRQSLKHKDMKVSVGKTSDPLEFDADLSFDGYALPNEALISIEAYRQTMWKRFPCGTVGNFRLPADRRLEEFNSTDAVRFRVRVTSSDVRKGLLLAEADNIQPRCPESPEQNRKNLLSVLSDGDLGKQIFRLDMSHHPTLHINSCVGDWKAVARDPVFCSLVYPSVVRDVLRYILRVEKYRGPETLDGWKSDWIAYARPLTGEDVPPHDQEDKIDDWIEEAVSSFSRRKDVSGGFMKYWNG